MYQKMDGEPVLCYASACCLPYYCERCEFYLLAGYKHYVFACLSSIMKPLQHLTPPYGAVAGMVAACRRLVLVLEMLLLKNLNTGVFCYLSSMSQKQCWYQSLQELSDVAKQHYIHIIERGAKEKETCSRPEHMCQVSWGGNMGSPQLQFSLAG